MNEFVQLTVNGLVTGSIIAIGAVGLTLVYGILKIVNFAHGDYLTFGAYMAFVVNVTWGLHPIFAALFAIVTTVALAVSLEFALWRPMRGRGAGVTSLFLTSIGLALVLRNSILGYFGTTPFRYRVDVFQSYDVGLFRISRNQITVIGVAFVLIVALGLFLSRSRIGKAMRALSDNLSLAAVSGIDTNRIVIYTWILAGGLAGLSGMLLAILQASLNPNSGFNLLLSLFAAVVLGGVGSAYGALAGGVAIGLVTEISTLAVPFQYKSAIAFGAMILALLVRPQGLFGRARVL
jgi:branched-chain amino acid transport system permease protein